MRSWVERLYVTVLVPWGTASVFASLSVVLAVLGVVDALGALSTTLMLLAGVIRLVVPDFCTEASNAVIGGGAAACVL